MYSLHSELFISARELLCLLSPALQVPKIKIVTNMISILYCDPIRFALCIARFSFILLTPMIPTHGSFMSTQNLRPKEPTHAVSQQFCFMNNYYCKCLFLQLYFYHKVDCINSVQEFWQNFLTILNYSHVSGCERLMGGHNAGREQRWEFRVLQTIS